MRWELEEVARAALKHADQGAPVDPEIVADQHGLDVRSADTDGLLIGRTIYVCESLRRQRRWRGCASAGERCPIRSGPAPAGFTSAPSIR